MKNMKKERRDTGILWEEFMNKTRQFSILSYVGNIVKMNKTHAKKNSGYVNGGKDQ